MGALDGVRFREGDRVPWWIAPAWRHYPTNEIVCYPIGVHFVARWVRQAWWFLRTAGYRPGRVERAVVEMTASIHQHARDRAVREAGAVLRQQVAEVTQENLRLKAKADAFDALNETDRLLGSAIRELDSLQKRTAEAERERDYWQSVAMRLQETLADIREADSETV